MLPVVAFVFSLVASTLAYSIITPGDSANWTNVGSQSVTWQRVATDPLNFTMYLTNQVLQGFKSQVLEAQVDGTLGNMQVPPPSGGWPTGSNFRLNFVQDPQDLDTILCQSGDFSIIDSTTSSTTGSVTSVLTASNTDASITVSTPTTDLTGTSDSSGSSSASILPTGSSAAALSYTVQTGLLGFFALLGFVLA